LNGRVAKLLKRYALTKRKYIKRVTRNRDHRAAVQQIGKTVKYSKIKKDEIGSDNFGSILIFLEKLKLIYEKDNEKNRMKNRFVNQLILSGLNHNKIIHFYCSYNYY
jgi:hypothetical protein